MKRLVFILLIMVFCLTAVSVVQYIGILEYKNQIKDLRHMVSVYNRMDTVMGIETDSSGNRFYVIDKDAYGNDMTYSDLSKLTRNQERIILSQDFVILTAKRLYKFNYSVKDSADMIRVRFWDKE